MKMEDVKVVVNNKNMKLEQKGFSGKGDKPFGCETVWNDVGENRTGLALMNEDLRNHEEHIGEKQEEWGVAVK